MVESPEELAGLVSLALLTRRRPAQLGHAWCAEPGKQDSASREKCDPKQCSHGRSSKVYLRTRDEEQDNDDGWLDGQIDNRQTAMQRG